MAIVRTTLKAFAALDPPARNSLEADIDALLARFNTARDGSFVAPGEYFEAIVTRKG